jgi:hypothetical protein
LPPHPLFILSKLPGKMTWLPHPDLCPQVHVPAHLDTWPIQFMEFYRSLLTGDDHLGSPRRSSIMRRAWKTGVLGTVRLWFKYLKTEKGKDDETFELARKILYYATQRARISDEYARLSG